MNWRERLGLDLDRHTRKLSKGNKQKLGLVQAFMHQPELLVLDEPTSGLDPLVQQEFHAMVREARRNGQTVFLSSHVLSEIQQTADTVAILRDGRIIAVESVTGLRESAVRHVRFTASHTAAPDAVALLTAVPGIGTRRGAGVRRRRHPVRDPRRRHPAAAPCAGTA